MHRTPSRVNHSFRVVVIPVRHLSRSFHSMFSRSASRLAVAVRRSLSATTVVLVAAACAPDAPLVQQTPALAPLRLTTVGRDDALPATVRDEEAVFAALSQRVPSSAGYYVDASGNTVILLRVSTRADAARQAFEQVRPANHGMWAKGGVRVAKGEYSFGQLAKWRDALFEHAFNRLDGTTSLDLNEVRNRVVIGVDRSNEPSVTAAILAVVTQLGIDKRAVEIRAESPMRWTAPPIANLTAPRALSMTTTPTALTQAFPALAGGILITTSQTDPRTPAQGGPGFCSLGFTAFHTPSGGSGYRAMVTATHCTAIWGAPDNTTFTQGGVYGGMSAVDPHKYQCGWNWCRASDAALSNSMPGCRTSLASSHVLAVRTAAISIRAARGSSFEEPRRRRWVRPITRWAGRRAGRLVRKKSRASTTNSAGAPRRCTTVMSLAAPTEDLRTRLEEIAAEVCSSAWTRITST